MTTDPDRPHVTDFVLVLLLGRRGGDRDLEDGARRLLERQGVNVVLDPTLWPTPAAREVVGHE
jgi:hypothetical protein